MPSSSIADSGTVWLDTYLKIKMTCYPSYFEKIIAVDWKKYFHFFSFGHLSTSKHSFPLKYPEFWTNNVYQRILGRVLVWIQHFEYKQWVSFFSGFMGNESSNKSYENREAVHAICLSRTTIHSPWTQKKDTHSSIVFCVILNSYSTNTPLSDDSRVNDLDQSSKSRCYGLCYCLWQQCFMNIFLARRDECPESYCRTPGVGVGVGVHMHKNFNLAYNSWTTIGRPFIFLMCIPCDKTFPWIPKFLTQWPWPWSLTYF